MNPRTVFQMLTSRHIFKSLKARTWISHRYLKFGKSEIEHTFPQSSAPFPIYILVYLVLPYIQGRNLKIIFNFSLSQIK